MVAMRALPPVPRNFRRPPPPTEPFHWLPRHGPPQTCFEWLVQVLVTVFAFLPFYTAVVASLILWVVIGHPWGLGK